MVCKTLKLNECPKVTPKELRKEAQGMSPRDLQFSRVERRGGYLQWKLRRNGHGDRRKPEDSSPGSK